MKPQFTHKDKGYKVPFIGAKKMNGESYETETECKQRVESMFDVDDVECFWDEERSPPGFVAGPSPDVSAPSESDDDEEEKPVLEDPDPPKVGFSSDEKSEEDSDDKEFVEAAIPSVDGARTYDVAKKSTPAQIDALVSQWEWTEGPEKLLDKLDEETQEARTGNSTGPTIDGTNITVNGMSSLSEVITVGVIVFKYLNQFHDIKAQDVLTLIHLRHQEQYDRYHAKETPSEDEVEESSEEEA